MFVLMIEPGKEPYATEVESILSAMQNVVGGLIQALYPFADSVALVCNEEGKLLGLPMNRGLRDESGALYDVVCGTFFLCGAPPESESFMSLSPEEIERYSNKFQHPELFVKLGGDLLCLPL